MKTLRRIILVALVAICASSTAMAQFKFGPKLGVAVNDIHFNKDVLNDITSEGNRAGFTGGIAMEYIFPVVNLGFDASLMYVHRSTGTNYDNEDAEIRRDYIELPINLKYKIGLPVVGKIITPYVFTGPSFAVLVSKNEIAEALDSKSFDVAWNIGVGVELISHLQIGASYAFGVSNSLSNTVGVTSTQKIKGKNRYWTVTAAWMF